MLDRKFVVSGVIFLVLFSLLFFVARDEIPDFTLSETYINNPYPGGDSYYPEFASASGKKWQNQWNGLPGHKAPIASCPVRPPNEKNEAYVMLLLTPEYMIGVLKIHCALKKHQSTRPLIVLYSEESVSVDDLEPLRAVGITAYPVELLRFPNYFAKRFEVNWTRLRLWQFSQYTKLIYMDADMFPLTNVDHLFDLPAKYAAAVDTDRQCERCGPMGFNQAGLLVIEPCAATFQEMLTLLENNETLQFQFADAEQGFLNYYFQYNRLLLPPDYNFLPHQFWNTPLRANAKVLHYTENKPFHPWVKHRPEHEPWLACEVDPSLLAV